LSDGVVFLGWCCLSEGWKVQGSGFDEQREERSTKWVTHTHRSALTVLLDFTEIKILRLRSFIERKSEDI
jgi:hypothetical protein